ncbi:MAG: hypothetical protein ABEJ42_08335 [Halobacteriaceae archaeon]
MDEHGQTDPSERLDRPGGHPSSRLGLTRYDLVLVAIPLVLALGLGGVALSVPSTQAVGAAVAVATLTVADALFRNPPNAGAS